VPMIVTDARRFMSPRRFSLLGQDRGIDVCAMGGGGAYVCLQRLPFLVPRGITGARDGAPGGSGALGRIVGTLGARTGPAPAHHMPAACDGAQRLELDPSTGGAAP
jgi:hypothetical protein